MLSGSQILSLSQTWSRAYDYLILMQTYWTSLIRPALLVQTYGTLPIRPALLVQTYGTLPIRPALLVQTYGTLPIRPALLVQTYGTSLIRPAPSPSFLLLFSELNTFSAKANSFTDFIIPYLSISLINLSCSLVNSI